MAGETEREALARVEEEENSKGKAKGGELAGETEREVSTRVAEEESSRDKAKEGCGLACGGCVRRAERSERKSHHEVKYLLKDEKRELLKGF